MHHLKLSEPQNLTRLPEQKVIRSTSPIDNSEIIHYKHPEPQKTLDQTLIRNSMSYLNNSINVMNLGQLCELEHVLHDRIKSLSKHTTNSSISSDVSLDSILPIERTSSDEEKIEK